MTALEEEKDRRVQEEQSTQAAIEKAGTSALEAFRKSEGFIKDLDEFTLPSFMFGYTSAIHYATPFLTPEQLESLHDKPNFNEDAKELCDRMAEGIQAGRDLAEVREEFNKWLSEFDLDGAELHGEDDGADGGGGGVEVTGDNQDAGVGDSYV